MKKRVATLISALALAMLMTTPVFAEELPQSGTTDAQAVQENSYGNLTEGINWVDVDGYGKCVLADAEGNLITGEPESLYAYVNSNGETEVYYFEADGYLACYEFVEVDGKTYFLDEDGVLVAGENFYYAGPYIVYGIHSLDPLKNVENPA